MPFERKEIKNDILEMTDFSKVLPEMTTHQFAMKIHEEVVRDTKIVMNEKSQFDMADINRILSQYPSKYAWIIVIGELINETFEKEEDEYNDWYSAKYIEASEMLAGKPTIDRIKAEMVAKFGPEITERKNKVRDLRTKANIAKGMVRVWGNAINSLQSLSKNIAIEMEMIKRNLEV